MLKTGDLEAKTISKQENKDEIRRILAYVYLREHKAVLFSAFSTFFWLSVPSTILIRQWTRPQLGRSGYPDPDTR